MARPRLVAAALVVALAVLAAPPAGAVPTGTTTAPTTQTTVPTSTPPTSTAPAPAPPRPLAKDRSHAVFAPDGCPTTPPDNTLRVPATSHLTLYQLCADSVRDARTPAAALAIRFALSELGTPYSQARRNAPHIYDCSSFVTRAYQAAGVPIAYPATPNRIVGTGGASTPVTQTMVVAPWATPVTPLTVRPGDLVFFPGSDPPNGHVGMVLAHHVIVHTNASGDVAHVSPLNAKSVTAWRAVDPTKVRVRVDRDATKLVAAARDAHARYVAASSRLAHVHADIVAAQSERILATRQLDEARARRTAAAHAEDVARGHLRNVAVTSYMQSGGTPPAAVLLSASSVMETARVDKYSATLGGELSDAIASYERAKAAAEAEARRLERRLKTIDAHIRNLEVEARREQSALANALADPSAPILGPSELTAQELADWYHATGRHEAAGFSVNVLAQRYIEEGNRAGVRGDVAFAEAVLDTDGFSFPATGALTGRDNGVTLAGGCDTCRDIASYPSIVDAVRAQVQLLRVYADAAVNEHTLGAAPVVPHVLDTQLKGTVVSWRQLPGMNDTAPEYGNAILHTYDEITSWVAAYRVKP